MGWGEGSTGPEGANISAAYTGWGNYKTALDSYPDHASWCCPKLSELKLLTIGGGTDNGMINANRLKALKKASSMQAIKNAGYAGIIIDATKI